MPTATFLTCAFPVQSCFVLLLRQTQACSFKTTGKMSMDHRSAIVATCHIYSLPGKKTFLLKYNWEMLFRMSSQIVTDLHYSPIYHIQSFLKIAWREIFLIWHNLETLIRESSQAIISIIYWELIACANTEKRQQGITLSVLIFKEKMWCQKRKEKRNEHVHLGFAEVMLTYQAEESDTFFVHVLPFSYRRGILKFWP